MALRLFIARGNHQGQSFIAVQPTVLIGREPGCDVVLTDSGVSARHVRVVERGGRYFLEDLKSANGTLVNGESIASEHEVKSGDALGIGTAVLQLSVLDAPDLTERKRLVPSGVQAHPKKETGDRLPAPDEEQTSPVGRPLKFEADTEKTAPIGRPLVEEPPPPRPEARTEQAQALFAVVEPPLPTPERERETMQQARSGEHELDPNLRPTGLVPGLPAAAEAMTSIDAAVIEAAVQAHARPTRAPGQPAQGALVPASEVLRQKPDQASVDTKLVGASALQPRAEDVTDPSGAARPELPPPESAADRARRRRQASATLGGQLGWYWSELTLTARLVIGGVTLSVLLVVALGLWQVFRPVRGAELPPEPSVLTAREIPYSFGVGDGVDYEHVDFKELRFEVAAPTAVAVMVHYRAQDIAGDEVVVTLNDQSAGFVPADMGMPDRELETLLSPFALKKTEPNVVLFDNVKNPPGKEAWRISNLWMELIPVPEATPEQAMATAKQMHAKAQLLEKQRSAGDDTLFKLWRTYRAGWIALLVLKEDQRTWLFADLKRRCDATRVELDVQCGTLMLEAKKQIELKNPEGAREILEGVSRWFPTRDHPCPAIADEKLAEYDL